MPVRLPVRRTLTAALGGLALAASAATGVGGSAVAAGSRPGAAATPPVLSLYAPSWQEAYAYDGYVYTDLGLQLVAGDDPVEIHAQRPTYDDQIQATWESPTGPVPLPAGSMESFAGLDNFLTVKVISVRTGKKVSGWSQSGCFNGAQTQRIDPDGPARSPYPRGCPWNPYTVGSVMGIQARYSTSLMQDSGRELKVRPGRYDVVATIAPRWATFFGLPADAATVTSRLVVKKDSGCCYGRPRAAAGSTTALEPAGTAAPADPSVAPDPATEPDLRALPSFGIQLNRTGTQLRFGATVWNAGPSPMVVDGYRSSTDPDHMDAYQYFYDAAGNETGHQLVGEMHWHAANHNHWHFEDFARYRLLDADRSLAVKSGKQSFCLAPTDPVDLTRPGADWQQEVTDLGSACGGHDALAVREALPAGWGDTYFQFRAGQSFGIKNVPDGVYFISVEANPLGNLFETDTTNNTSVRKIRLSTTATGQRRVKVFQVGIVDESLGNGYGMFRG